MKAVSKILAGGAALAALVSAAPAAAQYGYPYGGGAGGAIGSIINGVLGGGYGYDNYGYSQATINRCTAAVQSRINRGYGYNPYGYNAYGNARVLGITSVEPRSSGGLKVRGVATSGINAGYGYGYNQAADLTFTCRTDYRGFITDVDVDRNAGYYNGNGYNNGYNGYNGAYGPYGYRRY